MLHVGTKLEDMRLTLERVPRCKVVHCPLQQGQCSSLGSLLTQDWVAR